MDEDDNSIEFLQGLRGECFHDFSQSCRTGLCQTYLRKAVRLCRHRRRRLFAIRHPDVLMENFSKKGLKIFVEKGEVEQI
jgi:hypothetical protein